MCGISVPCKVLSTHGFLRIDAAGFIAFAGRALKSLRPLITLLLIPYFLTTLFGWEETGQQYHQRMQWWKDGRLGLFLHWGVYSTFGGEYQGRDHGKEMGHASAEWIYLKSNMPQEDYIAAAKRFNPIHYNPKEWARMAKQAGMVYMVLTAKHHDGFALFDTEASDWDAVSASGAGRDLFREYVDACRSEGLKVGFYYSHEKDWWHHARQTVDREPLEQAYMDMVKTHLRELFTNYGRIDLIWFDTPVPQHEAFNRECAAMVRELQPQCIINGRIGNDLGDYRNIGDRAIVDPGEQGYFESIMTMRLNWGYDRNDDYWKSSAELISMVSNSACRSSNFLLNIGPTPEGTFPPEDMVRLHDMGVWMDVNGEAIRQTEGSPFLKVHPWGSITFSSARNAVYLHLYDWEGGDILLNGLVSKVVKAEMLGPPGSLQVEQSRKDAVVRVSLPAGNPYGPVPVVKLTLDGDPQFNLDMGPSYVARKVDHQTAAMLRGTITNVDGIRFSIKGVHNTGHKLGYELFGDEETSMELSLNDHVRFRTSRDGDIRSVQGYPIVPGQVYDVVYTPHKNAEPELEILTLYPDK